MSSRESSSMAPANVLQRPSSARTQDISHLLSKKFGDLFMRDTVDPQMIDNLRVTQGSDDPYHEKYVQELLKVTSERQLRLNMCSRLERSLMQAKARAMSADERQLNKERANADPNVEIPAKASHLRDCLDNDLLRENGLLCPRDLTTIRPPPVPMPGGRSLPSATRLFQASASSQRSRIVSGSNVDGQGPDGPITRTTTRHDSLSSHMSNDSDSELGAIMEDADHATSPTRTRTRRSRSAGSKSIRDRDRKLKMAEEKRKKGWQEQLGEGDRERDRWMLHNLDRKVNFLKNPRHCLPHDSNGTGTLMEPAKRLQKTVPQSETPIFLANPEIVLFTDYQIGSVYELTLDLKNITTTMRNVRVLPPKSHFFSVGLGQFPGERGLIAPGMSCQYTIRFSPDSLCDFEDCLVVETQDRERPLVVRLEARRPRPVLTVPSVWDAGECLVFGSKVIRYEVQNRGGQGRFVLLSKDAWPTTNFKTAVTSDSLVLPPFLIRPAYFELKRNQSTTLEVVFMPAGLGSFEQEFIILADNCHMRNFGIKGVGELAGVDLLSVEGGLSDPVPGEMCDVTAPYLVRYDTLHPFTYSQRKVTLQNVCHVDLMYAWKLVKPHCVAPRDPDEEEGLEVIPPRNRTLDLEAPFAIEPQIGVLKAGAISEFTITFAPTEISNYHSVIHLVLQNIPDIVASRSTTTVPSRLDQDRGDTGEEQREEESPDIALNDITGLEMELKGASEPLDVRVEPHAVLVAGKILINTTLRRQVKLSNHSKCPVSFCWEGSASQAILEVEPRMGMIGSGEEGMVEVCITGTSPGRIQHTLLCHVENLDDPVALQVEAVVKGPEISIEQPALNFGLVRLGETVERPLYICNNCQIPCSWAVQLNDEDTELLEEFKVSPVSGELLPLGDTTIQVLYTPLSVKQLRTVLEIHVADGTTSCIGVKGVVQGPRVCLLECSLQPEDLFLHMTSTYKVTLCNQTELGTAFKWEEASGLNAGDMKLHLEPSSGFIAPREELDILVQLTPQQIMIVEEYFVSCSVEGMDDPVILSVRGQVRGLEVSFKTPNPDQDGEESDSQPLCLNFGAVALWSVHKRYLHIRNHTSIPADFSLAVDYFRARPPTPPANEKGETIDKPSGGTGQHKRVLLGKTPNLADPRSKPAKYAQFDFCKLMLRERKGAAFSLSPSSGRLSPYGEQVVEVTAYNDMWGDLQDTLICSIADLPPSTVPINMSVTGCPIEFTMTAGRPDHQPIVRFGTRTNGSAPVTRPIRMNNKSPFDLRLDWEMYALDNEDSKLLDLCVSYGKPFPLKDADGVEIPPAMKDDHMTPPPRMPSWFIPDTPDTSLFGSRGATEISHTPTDPLLEAPDRPKVISVIVRPHDGCPRAVPYTIEPKQLVIPAESFEFVHVTFTPEVPTRMTLDEEKGLPLAGYTLGFLSVDDPRANIEGKVDRKQGYNVEQIKLDLTGKIDAPLVNVDYNDDEEFFWFQCVYSELLERQTETMLLRSVKACSAVLRNCKETPTVFSIATQHPFIILKPKPNDEDAQLAENVILRPRETCTLEIGYVVESSILTHAQNAALETADSSQPLRVTRDGHERVVRSRDAVTLTFSNGTQQLLPCMADVAMPALTLNKTALDFETCFVGQRREMQVQVRNPTRSHSVWRVRVAEYSENVTDDVFEVTPQSGYLEAAMTPLSKDRSLVRIFFTPKHSEEYEIMYSFEGLLGEEEQTLLVTGKGSYDEKYQEVYNI